MPLPEHLEKYDRVVPGCARIIVDEFQANSRHSREIEIRGIAGMINRDTRAQWMAFVLVLAGFYLIWQLADHGHDSSAIAVATTLLVGIVTAFLTGHRPWNKAGNSDKNTSSDDE
ncbi:DUF2335 domain-containing protein [Burkholderia multivorans]|nr:DUF2335 domain-containing protein [Burkholderia multivorans]